MGIIEDVFQMEGKGMQRLGKIENVKKKIHARVRKMIYHRISDLVWASDSGRKEVCGSLKKFSGRGSRKKSGTPQGMWPLGVRTSSQWLC